MSADDRSKLAQALACLRRVEIHQPIKWDTFLKADFYRAMELVESILDPAPSEPERLEAERKTWENRLPCE